MPDDSYRGYEQITVSLPPGQMIILRQVAAAEFRTPELQAAMYVSSCLPAEQDSISSVPLWLAELRRMRIEASMPSYRDIARNSGGRIAHSTAGNILTGSNTPSWHTIEILVQALGGNVERFRDLWHATVLHHTEPGTDVPGSGDRI